MEISLLALQIAVIFLPGIIWARIDASYGLKKRARDTEFFLRAFMFGMVSYAVTFLGFSIANIPFAVVDLGTQPNRAIVTPTIAYEIAFATGASFGLSILWLYVTNYKLLSRLLQMIGATKTYGDEDVWDFTFNSRKAAVEYVHMRDFTHSVVYSGWVDSFSEAGKLRELVLNDAQIYDFDGQLMFEIPSIYIARKPEDIHVEFPYRDKRGERHDDEHE